MKKIGSLILLVGLSALASPAFAGITIDFGTGTGGVGGSFSLTGGGNATGANIPIGTVTISGAPSNNGVYTVNGGVACAQTPAGGQTLGCGALSFNTTPGSDFIQVFGDIPQLGINTPEILLSGTITSFLATVNGLSSATGPDTKAANLLAAIGLPADTQFGFFGFTVTTNGQSPDSIISTDIRNTSVPEPSSIALFGTVLFACAALLRRKAEVNRA